MAGAVPDPQLHSHVAIASVERADGTVAAVRSRPAFVAAREVGAFYRAELAAGLRELGYETVSAGKDQRYFGIRGVGERVNRAFSRRTGEVHRAAQRFRAEHGRDPERGELRSLALRTLAPALPHRRRRDVRPPSRARALGGADAHPPHRRHRGARRVARAALRRSGARDGPLPRALRAAHGATSSSQRITATARSR